MSSAPPPSHVPPAEQPSPRGRGRTRGRVLVHPAALLLLVGVELGAALLPRVPSPTAALATALVRLAPGGLASWFLQTFRGAARPLTLAAAMVLLVAAGSLSVRASTALRRQGAAHRDPLHVSASATRSGQPEQPQQAAQTPEPSPSRRTLLVGLGLGGALLLGLTFIVRPGDRAGQVALADQLRVARGLPPLTASQDVSPTVAGLSPTLTPVADFYRIDTALRIPVVDEAGWVLRIGGRVREEVELTFDELVGLGLEEHDVTIACVSNLVGGDLVGTARWTGVPLARVLELAGPDAGAGQLVARSVDGWTAGFPVEHAAAPGALVAVGMNGVRLPARHGYPARLIVPGLYGYVSATKWVTQLELRGWDEYDAYWIRRGWAKEGPMKTMTRIDVPATAAVAGAVRVAGVAWAGDRGVRTVEVRVDDGPWREAACSEPLGDAVWRQWWLEVDLPPGDHQLQARAVDGTGALQPRGPRDVLPDGAEGWHVRMVRVRAA
jgi:DMSO/TMAO reductase YedYZ molybdopterin-dependent catalytic subunit